VREIKSKIDKGIWPPCIKKTCIFELPRNKQFGNEFLNKMCLNVNEDIISVSGNEKWFRNFCLLRK
jgi:hypothetical protein